MSISLNTLETFGVTVKQVIHELDEVFPLVRATPEDSMEYIMYRSGQRSVVEWLQRKLKEEQ